MFDAVFTGNAASDPQARRFQSGDTIEEVSVGCSQGYFDQSHQWVDQGTLWVDVTLPSGFDVTQCHKGDRLLVAGPIRQRGYTGKDGAKHTSLSCRARQCAVVPHVSRQQGGYTGGRQQQPQGQQYGQQQGFGSQQDAWGQYQ